MFGRGGQGGAQGREVCESSSPPHRQVPVRQGVHLLVQPVHLIGVQPGHTPTARRPAVDHLSPHNQMIWMMSAAISTTDTSGLIAPRVVTPTSHRQISASTDSNRIGKSFW